MSLFLIIWGKDYTEDAILFNLIRIVFKSNSIESYSKSFQNFGSEKYCDMNFSLN